MFSLIKNKFSLENNFNVNVDIAKQEQDNNNVEDFWEITYDVEHKLLFNKNNLPIVNKDCIYSDAYLEIFKKIQETLDSFWGELWINKITITNTGNKEIKLKDFYQNDKLRFDISSSVVAIVINDNTQKYINTSIKYYHKDFVQINFDTIEPNDSIIIDVISLRKLNYTKLYGKTKYFDSPKEYDKYRNYQTIQATQTTEKTNKRLPFLLIFMIILLLLGFGLSLLETYLQHSHKDLYIRNPFVLKEVQNAK